MPVSIIIQLITNQGGALFDLMQTVSSGTVQHPINQFCVSMEGRKLRCTQQVVGLIRHLRRKKEYSQEYMAAHLDISQNAYSKLETGKIPMTIDRLCEVARILDIAPTELLAEVKLV